MIVIEGLAMPKGEDDGILIALYDGKAHQIGTKETFTASEVPAHGRLIDADALMNEFEKAQRTMQQHGREYSCSFMSSSQEISTEWYCVEDMLDNASTIIPASEEGE